MEDPVPLSLLNDFLFCHRRAALKEIEGLWGENEHTAQGDLLHEHADEPGYETDEGVIVLRALPLFSERYGLSGRADIVELWNGKPLPVEYKKSKRRTFDNDDVQLCAQALCLEEMFGTRVPEGCVYHAASKRRRPVAFTEELRAQTVSAIESVRELLESGLVPPAILMPRCDGCSLRPVCLPELTGASPSESWRQGQRDLWRV
jgi:CRISPR-associated exonuclease Cas4